MVFKWRIQISSLWKKIATYRPVYMGSFVMFTLPVRFWTSLLILLFYFLFLSSENKSEWTLIKRRIYYSFSIKCYIFRYATFISKLRQFHSGHHLADKHSSFQKNIAAVSNRCQHWVRYDRPEIWTPNPPIQRRTRNGSTSWPMKIIKSTSVLNVCPRPTADNVAPDVGPRSNVLTLRRYSHTVELLNSY